MSIDLERLKKLYTDATPGEWKMVDTSINSPNFCIAEDVDDLEDGPFIVAVHNEFPAMAAEIERMRTELLAKEAEIQRLWKQLHGKPQCEHERLNDHGDACLDCGSVFFEGNWQ